MANEAPVYLSRAATAGLGQVQPVDTVGGERTAGALSQLGATVAGVGAQVQTIARDVDVSSRKTKYLEGLDALHQEADKDPDYTTAPQRFQERARALREQIFSGAAPSDRAALDLWGTGRELTGLGEVRRQTLTKQQSQFAADVSTQGQAYLKRYDAAASDTERAATKADYFTFLDDGVRKGMITAAGAAATRRSFEVSGVGVNVQRQIAADPAGAMRDLEDTAKYPELDPAARQQALTQARTANDERKTLELNNRAQHNPAGAVATVGRAGPQDAGQIFDKAIAPVEGGTTVVEGSRVGLQSQKGALGVGQIMPGTAREIAADMGRSDLLAMSDQQLRMKLLEDHDLNRQLSVAYFAKNLRRYEGSVPAAIAAYHAGPGGADPAYKRAVEKYGSNFTAEQFAGELSLKLHDGNMSTADYVRKAYGKMGADVGGPGLSVNANWRAAQIVDARLASERAEQTRLLNSMISAQAGERNQTIAGLWDGYRMDGAALAQMKAPLLQAAAMGDAGAATQLRKFQFAEAAAPAIQEARRTAPAELTARLDAEEQQFQMSPPSEFQALRHKAMRAVAERNTKALKEFPTEILRGAGVAPVVPLDAGASPSDPGFAAALAARGQQADYATRALPGAELKVFSPEETAAFKAKGAQGTDGDRLAMLGALRGTLSPKAFSAAVQQLYGDDPTARVAGQLAGVDMGLARDVLAGAKLLELPEVKAKGPELHEALKRVAPANLWPGLDGAQLQSDAIGAALAVYAAQRGRTGLLYETPDRNAMEAALGRVIGETTTRGGKRVAVPHGMPASVFHEALNALTAADLAPFGGASWSTDSRLSRDAAAIDPQWLGREARLSQIGLGGSKYGVTRSAGGGREDVIYTAQGLPLIIDMAQLVKGRNPTPPPPPGLAGALQAEAALGGGLLAPKPGAPARPGDFTPFQPDASGAAP